MAEPPVPYDDLAENLAALAYPMRLELLYLLRFPHAIGELRVTPRRVEAGGNPDRPAAKQTVQAHLDKLEDAGLVRVETSTEAGKAANRYVVNPQRLYAITEDMRRLSLVYMGRGAADDATGTLAAPARSSSARGARLVLVHGVYEGKAYPFDERTRKGDAWTIGRRLDCSVSLDYDPYVSLDNSEIIRRGDAYVVRNLATSKNGTRVNWEDLDDGEERALESGDVIGVGRSLLVFRAS